MNAKPKPRRAKRVGVGELRQNLSKYLVQVKAGQRLEVTEHGHPVALLTPLPPADDYDQRLAAAGLAFVPASRPAHFELPPGLPAGAPSLSAHLASERDLDASADAALDAALRRL